MTNQNIFNNNLPKKRFSINKWLKILGSIVIIIAILITAVAVVSSNAKANESITLWDLFNEMNWLRNLKEQCTNNLWIKDSAKFLRWDTWYCDERDEQIINLRNQINELWKKDYEGLR